LCSNGDTTEARGGKEKSKKPKNKKVNWTCVGRGNANKEEDKKAYPSVGKYPQII
jgi:hypothetical protein